MAVEILLTCILVPVSIACFALPFAVPDHVRFAEILPVAFIRVFGDERQRRRLRMIMAAREAEAASLPARPGSPGRGGRDGL